jgi:ATP-dependent Lhr-like helicase
LASSALASSLNASELAQRRCEIARGGAGFFRVIREKRSNKQLQASSSLFYEVFKKYDPANRLLLQAEQELLSQELRLAGRGGTERMNCQQLQLKVLARPRPCLPLMSAANSCRTSAADRIASHGGAARPCS